MDEETFSYQKIRVQEPIAHYKHGRFINPWEPNTKRKLRNVFLWKMGFYKDKKSSIEPGLDFKFPDETITKQSSIKSSVKWMGHSTFLVEVDGLVFITDPMFAKRASPLPFLGPKRKIEPVLKLHELPLVDVIIISHNHYDHFDKNAISYLIRKNPNIVIFVPLKLKNKVLKMGANRVFELDWWDKIIINDHKNRKYRVTSVPAQHCSGRRIIDRDKSLWCGWIVECDLEDGSLKRFYFAGDTGYNEHDFNKIGEVFKKIDLSIIPIGSYLPRKFMKPVHVSPEEAVSIHEEVGSLFTLASHFGTFKLSSESIKQPEYDLFLTLQKKQVSPKEFSLPKPGKVYFW